MNHNKGIKNRNQIDQPVLIEKLFKPFKYLRKLHEQTEPIQN